MARGARNGAFGNVRSDTLGMRDGG